MSRAGVGGLRASRSLVDELPGIMRADDFTLDFVGGLDEVLAPVLLTIDNLSMYLDPEVAPLDFVRWLASWFHVEVDASWTEARTRRTIARIARLTTRRGTASALAELVGALTDRDDVTVDDGGGVWPTEVGEGLPGSVSTSVRLNVDEPPPGSERLLRAFLPPGVTVSWG